MSPPRGIAVSNEPGNLPVPRGMRSFCDPGASPVGKPTQALAKTSAAAPLSIAQLNVQSYAQTVNAIASFTGTANDLGNFFQFNADTKAFYGDSNRVIALLDGLKQRAASFTAQDTKGIPSLVEVIRAGFFLGFYNTDLVYLKASGAFAQRLVAVQASFFANAALGFAADKQVEVLTALGALMGIGVFGAETISGLTALTNQYLAKLPGYGADDTRTSALYSMLSGFDYGLIGVHLYALNDDAGKSPWNGKLGALYGALRTLSLDKEALKSNDYLLNNAAYWLARWGRFVPKTDAVAALPAIIDAFPKVSTPTLEASRGLSETYGGVDAHGKQVDMKGVLADVEATLLPVHLRFDSGAVIIKAGGQVDPSKLVNLYWTMKETAAQFHRLIRKDSPLVTPAVDDSITMVIYNSPDEYQYNRFLHGISTANGGMYIEGDGTFYTYERTPAQSIYTLEELFRHEYTHYLDSRFLIPGIFGGSLYDNDRLTWFDEGLAEFIAGGTRTQGVLVRKSKVGNLDKNSLMTLDQVTRAAYNGDFTFYDYAALLMNYMNEHRKDLLFSMFAHLRANDGPGFDQVIAGMRSDAALGDAYRAYMLDEIQKLPTLTIPSTSPLYLQPVTQSPVQDVVNEMSTSIAMPLTNAKVYRSPLSGGYFSVTGSYTANGDSLTAWEAMNGTLDGFLKTLNGKPWNGYQTMTGYFADPVAVAGGFRYRVVLRGKIENGDAAPVRPQTKLAHTLPSLSVPNPYRPGMAMVLLPASTEAASESKSGIATAVAIAIFDLQGNLMHQPNRIDAGRWNWDGDNRQGQRAAAGRYIVRVSEGSASEWLPIVLGQP